MKWMAHKPEDCDLGKKLDQQANKNQDLQRQVKASQASYTEMLAELAQLSINKWWCAPAWLSHSFLAMAESTMTTLMQSIFILTFPWWLCLLLFSVQNLSRDLDLQAPTRVTAFTIYL